jgi:hypothetical protein
MVVGLSSVSGEISRNIAGLGSRLSAHGSLLGHQPVAIHGGPEARGQFGWQEPGAVQDVFRIHR